MDPCWEAAKLLDLYVAKLNAFHDAQAPLLTGLLPCDPRFESIIRPKDEARGRLIQIRHAYWSQVNEHGCRHKTD